MLLCKYLALHRNKVIEMTELIMLSTRGRKLSNIVAYQVMKTITLQEFASMINAGYIL